MTGLVDRFGRLYGARPWHLLSLLLCFALAAYAVSRVLDEPTLFRLAAWFVGAAVVWDLFLGPLYALLDAGLRRASSRLRASGVSPLNYVRVPALLSSLLLIVWAPLILQRSEAVYRGKSGLLQDPYLERWLGVSAVLFAAAAVAFAVAVVRARRSTVPPPAAPAASPRT